MWHQFNKQNLVYRFMGPIWQLANNSDTLNSVVFVLSDNSCAVGLIFQSTHYYRKQFLIAVLRARPSTFPNRLRTVGDLSPSISML